MQNTTMRMDGTLKSWNDDRGFGFIAPAMGGQDIFAHIKSFPPGTGRPTPGLALSFTVEVGPDGKKRARAVQFARRIQRAAPVREELSASWSLPRRLAIPVFVIWYAYVATHFSFEPIVAVAYIVVSCLAFVAYALDKSAAVKGRWRTSESTLHLLGLACGWPGALLAQQVLRHKTSKPSFVQVFWATVALNWGGLYVLHAPMGSGIGL